jgi:acyl-CoA thioesterase
MHFSTLMMAPAVLAADGQATVALEVGDDWLQGRSAFGGLIGAAALKAMRPLAGDLALRALQVTFVAPVDAGPLRAIATRLRQGRSVTHVQCRLETDRGVAAVAVGLFGAPRVSQASLALAKPTAPSREAVAEAAYRPGVTPPFLGHYRTHWVERGRVFSGELPQPLSVWARLREPQPLSAPSAPTVPGLDAATLNETNFVAIADLPPTPLLSMPTTPTVGASLTWLLECLVDPREFGADQWVLMRVEPRAAADGYVSQTGLVWDEAGRGLAVTHQTVAVFG